ncbi:hypothetical protein NPIL_594251 [Nephila pilipes]|uniref:HTH CENPB-type domain-containing protein n=1 Tax=Nephila pilipes TaxID=299642 RepID=A0A8X6U1Q1_NEPPI|nr:hypothetical protein NPIL_594251 [Nephila pilipes]
MFTYSELKRVFFAWYEQDHASYIPVDGNVFRKKAHEIAASMGTDTFSASNEWISCFKIRHDVVTINIPIIVEICDGAKNKNGEEAEDNVYADGVDPAPVPGDGTPKHDPGLSCGMAFHSYGRIETVMKSPPDSYTMAFIVKQKNDPYKSTTSCHFEIHRISRHHRKRSYLCS